MELVYLLHYKAAELRTCRCLIDIVMMCHFTTEQLNRRSRNSRLGSRSVPAHPALNPDIHPEGSVAHACTHARTHAQPRAHNFRLAAAQAQVENLDDGTHGPESEDHLVQRLPSSAEGVPCSQAALPSIELAWLDLFSSKFPGA